MTASFYSLRSHLLLLMGPLPQIVLPPPSDRSVRHSQLPHQPLHGLQVAHQHRRVPLLVLRLVVLLLLHPVPLRKHR